MLIIGGGDGGVLREVVKHPEVQSVEMCEIDEVSVRHPHLQLMLSNIPHTNKVKHQQMSSCVKVLKVFVRTL